MKDFRDTESDDDLDNVAATASLIPAMVAVITGGDPLTRPDRAAKLIDRLAPQKALVLDTSGVGDVDVLMSRLKQHNIHVRVSIDSVSEKNQKLRLPNKDFVSEDNAAFHGATRTLTRCLEEGIAVTVQTVVTSWNDDLTELINVRDWLVSRGVRHWVLHVTVKGGNARKIEDLASKKKRPGIVPSPLVYERIKKLIDETNRDGVPIDIRCTDTGNTPNSVLLVGSNGDLFTEGLAHNGKVKLFAAAESRPDLIRRYWHHVDTFGHARRYLNWNPWFYEGTSLESLCYDAKVPDAEVAEMPGVVEMEAKYSVRDVALLWTLLDEHATRSKDEVLQRDEYYDTAGRVLNSQDFVVRVRRHGDRIEVGMKGARLRSPSGEYSRVELEFSPKSEDELNAELARRDLVCTWFFEKRRVEFVWGSLTARVVVDAIPEIGYFVEIEGSLKAILEIETILTQALKGKEGRNYKELFVAFKQANGMSDEAITGAEFLDS